MHLNFNFQAVSIFFHGAKAILPLYESDSLKWSHTSSERMICLVDSLVRHAQISVVMVSMPASC